MKELQEMVQRWLREIEGDDDAPEHDRTAFLQAYFQERKRRRPGAGRQPLYSWPGFGM